MRLSRDFLIESFSTDDNSQSRELVGAEFERHLLLPDGSPLPYDDDKGVRWFLDQYAGRYGWARTIEGENTIALTRGSARVTLEPGAQLELSGSPFRTLTEVAAEANTFNMRVGELLEATGARQVALGFTPYADIPAVQWVPKGRYSVMRTHLAKTGSLAHHMMKGTCAVQGSYDFSNEEDCAEKVQLSTKLGPLTTAIFANSPLCEGREAGWASYRGHIWTETDPRRTGFPQAANAFSFAAWVDYLLDVPMIFYHLGDEYLPANGRSFRSWMLEGENGHYPGLEDWDLHLTSVFPEVRVKHAIEVRGADCVPMPLAISFIGLFQGLFYHPPSRHKALEIADAFASCGSQQDRFKVACRDGLRGRIGQSRLLTLAEEIFDLAKAGIESFRPEEVEFLRPLEEQIARGESPAHTLLRVLGSDRSPAAIIAATDFLGTPSEGADLV
jgi:glutamate--cysteine ligase